MAALRAFKIICGSLQLLLLLLLQDLVEPFQVQIEGPQGRITAGSRASFNCSALNFRYEDIKFVWMKDGKRIQSKQTEIIPLEGRPYYVKSSVTIRLGQGDVRSKLSCQVQYNSNEKIQKYLSLGDVLRVPPKLHFETIPTYPIQLNTSAMVICIAESFYPEDVKMELIAKDAPSRKTMFGPKFSNADGTFSFKSYLEVMVTKDRNSSMFLCQVQQDSQPPVTETSMLFLPRPLKVSKNSEKPSIFVLCMALFLSKVAILLLIFCLFLIKVCGHNRTRSHSATTTATTHENVKGSN